VGYFDTFTELQKFMWRLDVRLNYWNCWNSHRYSKIATGSTRLCWRSIRLLLLASFGAVEVNFYLRFAEAKFEFFDAIFVLIFRLFKRVYSSPFN
jgi:hypothetical protein